MTQQEAKEANPSGSHEKFWTFSQVSQWGSHWSYSNNDHLKKVGAIVNQSRLIGVANNCQPRLVHFSQLLIWRFFLKENPSDLSPAEIIPLAFDSAAQILDIQSPRITIPDPQKAGRQEQRGTDFRMQFNLVSSLDFNMRLHHPSDYIKQYINSSFTKSEYELAQAIISDSFQTPCCLVYRPDLIAEGAAIMAAGMLDQPNTVVPQTSKALAFIQDMKGFYNQNSNGKVM